MFKVGTWAMLIALPVTGAYATEPPANSFVNGEQLFEWCSAAETDGAAQAACGGYIMGVYDENSAAGRFGDDEFKYCPPDEVTTQGLMDITRQHLEAFPETRAKPASRLVLAALFNAFPCQETNSSD